jgi:hypothetical protein
MRILFAFLICATMLTFVACGPGSKKQGSDESNRNDSIKNAESITNSTKWLNGKWAGMFDDRYKSDNPKLGFKTDPAYEVTFDYNNKDRTGTMKYPLAGCTGTWKILQASDSTCILKEKVDNTLKCVDNMFYILNKMGNAELYIVGTNTFKTPEGYRVVIISSGFLFKKKQAGLSK